MAYDAVYGVARWQKVARWPLTLKYGRRVGKGGLVACDARWQKVARWPLTLKYGRRVGKGGLVACDANYGVARWLATLTMGWPDGQGKLTERWRLQMVAKQKWVGWGTVKGKRLMTTGEVA